ncbi:fungal-specific transcription factor domain-domain-containing protein [Coniella lustricola]|uniref:Fungal-specific transcription factor domain-domain-containing protein n=1 Tax=Coniella lustricola TaxID=2025994 RepID=A0A2T3A3D7_9PEZI|nr:fungal-specific transcription factor domain-domain-containing protein [Coniella lustricola]
MAGKRSRRGCEECRRRRRKCDEQQPFCMACTSRGCNCIYTLKLVWGGLELDKSRNTDEGGFVFSTTPSDGSEALELGSKLPRSLPNGISLPPRYYKLLVYFADDILASLSCHPSIHQDLCKGLMPATLEFPHLLSACLALSTAGFASRGIANVDGIDAFRLLDHLQSSGLSLLRSALEVGQPSEVLLTTCLMWSLVDVFSCRSEASSWRVHLQGVKAIIDNKQGYNRVLADSGAMHAAIKHLHMLYVSLQTLPYIFSPKEQDRPQVATVHPTTKLQARNSVISNYSIDGFLGYSEELLHILHQINKLADERSDILPTSDAESDILLGKVMGMIARDAANPPNVDICSVLSADYGREFILCHRIFQQTALIVLYRRLYEMPSQMLPIQNAVAAITEMLDNMPQGQPCHTWVAMALPVFTIGCEAFTPEQKNFVLDKVQRLKECLGSFHVGIIRQALKDVWEKRSVLGDMEGHLCAGSLLGELKYNIILF